MGDYTTKKEIQAICQKNNVRFAETEEQNNPVYSIHGYLADIEAMEKQRKTNGYCDRCGSCCYGDCQVN